MISMTNSAAAVNRNARSPKVLSVACQGGTDFDSDDELSTTESSSDSLQFEHQKEHCAEKNTASYGLFQTEPQRRRPGLSKGISFRFKKDGDDTLTTMTAAPSSRPSLCRSSSYRSVVDSSPWRKSSLRELLSQPATATSAKPDLCGRGACNEDTDAKLLMHFRSASYWPFPSFPLHARRPTASNESAKGTPRSTQLPMTTTPQGDEQKKIREIATLERQDSLQRLGEKAVDSYLQMLEDLGDSTHDRDPDVLLEVSEDHRLGEPEERMTPPPNKQRPMYTRQQSVLDLSKAVDSYHQLLADLDDSTHLNQQSSLRLGCDDAEGDKDDLDALSEASFEC